MFNQDASPRRSVSRNIMEIKNLIIGPIQTNCYLLFSAGEAAVIDPGADAAAILSAIKSSGSRLKYIINTHYHFDHTTANEEIKTATGAEILIHEAEKKYVNFLVNRWLNNNDEIIIGNVKLKVLNTPGHSRGSICLIGDDFIFTGDTLFYNDYGRTDLAGGSDEEMAKSLAMLKKIIKPGMMVYPGHGEIYTA
jgi:glyoxylase-like metal-dependent hydrolase (beta-lactamase superfamily II)